VGRRCRPPFLDRLLSPDSCIQNEINSIEQNRTTEFIYYICVKSSKLLAHSVTTATLFESSRNVPTSTVAVVVLRLLLSWSSPLPIVVDCTDPIVVVVVRASLWSPWCRCSRSGGCPCSGCSCSGGWPCSDRRGAVDRPTDQRFNSAPTFGAGFTGNVVCVSRPPNRNPFHRKPGVLEYV